MEETLKELLHAKPFVPFTVHLAEQNAIKIPHPEFALLTRDGRILFVNTEGSKVQHINVELITRVEKTDATVS